MTGVDGHRLMSRLCRLIGPRLRPEVQAYPHRAVGLIGKPCIAFAQLDVSTLVTKKPPRYEIMKEGNILF